MFGLGPATRIYVALGATDMRKGFDGLHEIVRDKLGLEVRTGHLFLFANARRNRLKILYWDGSGLWSCATLTLWQRLTRFLDYPVLELSNNLAENAIRPVALGRNYEQLRIRQSLTPAKPDFRRRALDVADRGTRPVFA